MAKLLRALIVEVSQKDATLLLRELERGGYQTTHERVDTAEALNAALDRQTWDIVFGGSMMPHFDGLAALTLVRERGLDLPFIFVAGSLGEDIAVETMKAVAHDDIMEGNLKRLLPAVERELREAEVRRAHRRAEELIQHMAYYDTLTDLPNRNMLYDRLLNAIRTDSSQGASMALLLMDLDGFKEINDTLGHHRGDLLLQQVGSRLRSVFCEPDLVARLGGDEFAILLPKLAAAAQLSVVEQKIVKALEAPFLIEGLPIAVEASVGIALYPDHGANPDSLLQRADVAMYAAKKSGGYVIYDAKHDRHSPRRLVLLGELRHALDRGQVSLHYQPTIDFATRQVTGVEALARWQHPEYGFIQPDHFIAPAERTGLIKPLTLWVLNAALRQCDAWCRVGIRLDMAVNLSARSLHDPQLPDQIARLLKAHGVAPAFLKLEITEGAIMPDAGRAMEILARLRDMGIRFSIDDFGTGHSSLGSLKELPVDEIKIDRSFVMDLFRNGKSAAIVHSTIDLGHHLGLKVVAEGVETQEVWNRLAALGCDAAQGYYMSRPLSAEAFTSWLRESPWGLKKGLGGLEFKAA